MESYYHVCPEETQHLKTENKICLKSQTFNINEKLGYLGKWHLSPLQISLWKQPKQIWKKYKKGIRVPHNIHSFVISDQKLKLPFSSMTRLLQEKNVRVTTNYQNVDNHAVKIIPKPGYHALMVLLYV